MLKSFVAWLDSYLAGEGPSAVIAAIVGLLGFAAVLGAVLGSTAIRTGVVVSAILLILVLILILLRDRRKIQRESDSFRRLLTRYCTFIADSPKAVARVKLWKQVAVLRPNGDTREIITIHAVSLRKELYFLRLKFGAGWSQPTRYHNRISVNVRSLLIDGTRGASWDVTSSWLPGGELEMFAHLHTPAQIGSELRLEMEWNWPGKCIPLMKDGHWDDFTFRFDKLMPIEHAVYEVILPRGADAYYDFIGFNESNGDFSVNRNQNSEGKTIFVFEGKNLPVGQSTGMRLELNKATRPNPQGE